MIAALPATAVVWASVNGDEVAPAAAARLSNLVRQDCGSCHGLTLKGGLGKPLTRRALRNGIAISSSAIILDGVPGTPMPPWRPLLTEAEARWIAAMLKKGKLK